LTTDPIAKLKILEATRLRLQLERRLQNLRSADLAALVTSFVAEEGISLNLLKEIYEADYRQTDLLTDPVWKANFMATVRVQAMKRFSMLDNLSMLGAMNSQPKAANSMRWNHIADAVWLSQMKPGMFAVITGNPGSGKTDIATRIAKVGISSGITVVSNITTKEWTATQKASDLIRALVSDTKPKLCLLDEMGVSWARKQAMSNRNIALEKLGRVIRKFKSSLIVIIQEKSTVPPLIEKFSTMYLHKESKTRCEVRISNKECRLDNTLTHVPKSTLTFNTDDIAPLDMDIDIDKVFSAASEGQGNPAKQRKAILAYLDKPKEDKKRGSDKAVRKEIAERLLGTMSQQKVARIVKLSPATVNKVAKLSHS